MKINIYLIAARISLAVPLSAQFSFPGADSIRHYSELDHQKMMQALQIDSLRPGRNGLDPKDPNYANYDESKANPYPDLPDPLILKNGAKVATAEMWWKLRRPEIVEDFDWEIYGRIPADVPAVKWEVISTKSDTNGGISIITKKILGHVDNSSCPSISVDIDLTLSTPAEAKRPVPVIMEFGFVFPPGFLGTREERDNQDPQEMSFFAFP